MQTGPDFREEHELADGRKIVLRHIQPSDSEELRRGFAALSPESRYRRFFGAVELDDRALRYLTEVDGTDHVALVAATESLDLKSERGVGVARFIRSAGDPAAAEAAVTVVDDMQQLGIGTWLTQALARAARERGIDRFRCEVLESNEPVVLALRAVGAKMVERSEGSLVLDVPIPAEGDGPVRRTLRIAAEQVGAFLRRLVP
ncbi:MAG TPA: GNAT family N-acetyltransferase [Polyangiaceae bacterium]|jgi:ribosomal protein S18 acetylase RimI-like enzyme